ncbi:hypothetical protein AGMMS49960_02580 [Betaproteobacteria bacterium]|nr:hypothetical protein AGMMS49543_24900 [Betaproteobacteria bacterium]GHT98793.1 hypothetical protein AGMMS49960_02580 [Betaproteobacteria bacterium]GHU18521.1 hypothetical protein AGMMS50243_08690 [Betaproteobacteria bacterium]
MKISFVAALVLGLAVSTGVLADNRNRSGQRPDRGQHFSHSQSYSSHSHSRNVQPRQSRQSYQYRQPAPRHYTHGYSRSGGVVVVAPPVYYAAPRYREPVVIYRDRDSYDEYYNGYYDSAPVVHYRTAPRYNSGSRHDRRNVATGRALGAITGGVIGHNLSRGHHRGSAIAAGAIVGAIIGEELAR